MSVNLLFSAANEIEHLRNNSNEDESALARVHSKQNNESITLNMENGFRLESHASEKDDVMTIFGTRCNIGLFISCFCSDG